ncbi:MAG: 3-phosphoshikimate 1-carboxyvinyltransferase [Candidatus Hermodarchaeota archaeon]
MDLEITPLMNSLMGEITAPGSKSYSHRAFIAASLAEGLSVIKNPLTIGDVAITIRNLKELGVKIIKSSENSYVVQSNTNTFKAIKKSLDCRNSGTSFRIFSALSLLVKGGLVLKGEFLKRNRPIIPLLNALQMLGAHYEISKKKIKIVREKILCNKIEIPGDISSQFLTALLFVCPLLRCEDRDYFEIELTTPLISVPYIRITLDVLNSFGINIQDDLEKGKFYITNEQNYRAQSYEIPGDFSSSAFIIAATVLSPRPSKVVINNLSMQNYQGDSKIIKILKDMGAKIEFNESKKQVIVYGDLSLNPLKGLKIDCKDIPDLFPILSVIGAYSEGETVLYNAGNLRLKESDRIAAMSRELKKMGVSVKEENETLTIYHCEELCGSQIDHGYDHRIAMACTIASLYANSNSRIKNIDIVKDSYPSFLEDLVKLGVKIET